jgi:hypothetical protein
LINNNNNILLQITQKMQQGSINIDEYIIKSKQYRYEMVPFLNSCFTLYTKKMYTIGHFTYKLTNSERVVIMDHISEVQKEFNKIEDNLIKNIGPEKTLDFLLTTDLEDINKCKKEYNYLFNYNIEQLNDILNKNLIELNYLLVNKMIYSFYKLLNMTHIVFNIIDVKKKQYKSQ